MANKLHIFFHIFFSIQYHGDDSDQTMHVIFTQYILDET